MQSSIKSLKSLLGIAEIHQQITEAAILEEDAYDLINRFIEQQVTQQEESRKKAEIEARKASEDHEQKRKEAEQKGESASVVYEPIKPAVPPKAAEPAPKKIVSLDTSSLMRDVNQSGVIETEQDIDTYLNALRDKLSKLVAANNKVRIK